MIDIKDVEEAIRLSEEIKKLETKKKAITDKLKTEMLASGQDVITHQGSKIQLVKQTRVSVKKNMKDKLLLFLKQRNLTSCITLTPELNKENLETEMNIGNITQKELDQYINYSEVNSIRVTV